LSDFVFQNMGHHSVEGAGNKQYPEGLTPLTPKPTTGQNPQTFLIIRAFVNLPSDYFL